MPGFILCLGIIRGIAECGIRWGWVRMGGGWPASCYFGIALFFSIIGTALLLFFAFDIAVNGHSDNKHP